MESRKQAGQESADVIIFTNSAAGKQACHDANEVIGLVCAAGVEKERIRIVDVARRDDVKALLSHDQTRAPDFPVLYTAGGHEVGGKAAVRRLAHDGRLRDAIAEAGSTSPAAATDFHLSAGDQWLNGIEWLLRTAATPLQALAPQSVIAARRESIKEVAAKGPLDIDFTVLRTNWYWRHQTRIYRMSTQDIIRIGPELMDKRDTMPYASIAKLVCSGERNLVIVFKAEARHSPEYIETPNRDDIVRLILERTPGQKPVVETA